MPKLIFCNPLFNFLKNLKKIYILAFFTSFLQVNSYANTYYFSSTDGNDSYSSAQAQNSSTPWKSLSKLNSFFSNLSPGDNVLFKSGDVFYGSINGTGSGSSGNPINFSSYGGGNKPLISGFTTVNSWTYLSSGIYQTNVSGASTSLNLVTINGVPQRIGRYPNFNYPSDPYLYYEGFTGNSITDNELTSSTNWTGAEVVIRKARWVLDRCKITNHSGGTLTYNNPTSYAGLPGYGYFIQNDPRTLDQYGEWYLNPSNKNLQLYFGGNQPSSSTVKVATIDNLFNLGNNSYISMSNLAFEGANGTGILAQNGTDITIQGCDFTLMGKDGVSIFNTPNILLENLLVNNVLNNGITIENSKVNNAVVRKCSVRNCGLFAGMGNSGDGAYRGVNVGVNSTATVEYNNIDGIGYNALEFQGSNVDIRYNYINNFCKVKDDGGGIYAWGNSNSYYNRNVYNNIILNAVGEPFGSSGRTAEAKGIYLDGGSVNVNIYNNSIAYIARTGLLLDNAQNIKLNANTVFDARWSTELVRFSDGLQIRNIELKKNIFYPKTSTQNTIYYKNWSLNSPTAISIQSDIQSIGNAIDSNYYGGINPASFGYVYTLNDGGTIQSATFSLNDWKSFINKDANSKYPDNTPATDNDLRFEYNATNNSKTVSLGASYVGVDNTIYNGSITLDPYTSKILIRNGSITSPPSTAGSFTVGATAPTINCFGGSTTVAVSASDGTSPYNGTGSYTVNAGTGTLKISVDNPVDGASTLLYSNIGAVNNAKTYVLKFSTVGTTGNGSLKAGLRQTGSPYSNITSSQSASFGTSRVDHQFIFNAPPTTDAASFIIELLQSSGTTYIDNIAVFESTSLGVPISNNLFKNGQFENDISNIYTWSAANNHVAQLDLSSKINNTYYYPIQDATGAITVASVTATQPASPLQATSTAGNITIIGGTTTVVISATGGTAPYSGTGSFQNVKSGSYNYTVTDAKGCSSVTTISISQTGISTPGISTPGTNTGSFTVGANAPVINCFGGNTTVTVTASGGTPPYTGTGSYTVDAGNGSLKISVDNPVTNAYTLLYSTIGAVSNAKTYVLKFSTLGTTDNGGLKAGLRLTKSPYTYITPAQTASFGTNRVDHQFIFNAPPTTDAASFIIELLQSSGTTYIDNIAVFEATSLGVPISNNLYSSGQFESNINGIYTWSTANNHVAQLDVSSKINNTYYYPIQDATGAISVASATAVQSASPLQAISTAGSITTTGGTTTVVISATGGITPYTGTGSFPNTKSGTYNYTVTDANGCSSVTTISISQAGSTSSISNFTVTTTTPAINCFGGNTIVAVSASGGTSPYTGTGSYTVDAGTGSLKISVDNPVTNAYTLLYSTIGAVSNAKTYVLKFSTLGTTDNGGLKAGLRLTKSPYTYITPAQTASFGTNRVDHQFIFNAPPTTDAASFIIELLQSSGTTYIDNIAVFEATSLGVPISNNLYSSGQFESDINGIYTWSTANNHVAQLDLSSKINNTYYFPIKDATGAITVAAATATQPVSPLQANSTVGNVTITGGSTTVVISATGGIAPYSGTGTFNASVGNYAFTVTDAKGCISTTYVTVGSAGSRIVNTTSTLAPLNSVSLVNPLFINSSPNPSTSVFNVYVQGGTTEQIHIDAYSYDGKLLYQTAGASNRTYTFGSHFIAGMYIIMVRQGNTKKVFKLVKG